MPIPRLLAAIVTLVLVGSPRPVAAADIAAWVYDFPRWSGNQYEVPMAALPPATRQVYASLEDGPRFLLDDEFRAGDIQRLVGALRERFGIAAHAMILQDTRWLDDPGGARERLARVLALNRYAPDRAFAGVHVDVEPHTLEDWECGGIPERRGLVQKLQALLASLASAIPPSAKDGGGGLRLSAALPWWIGSLSAEIPEASPRRFFESLDEIVLMAYGDPGGPLVGGSGRALLERLEDGRLWRDVPAGKGIRIGLATYEYASAGDLLATIRELDKALGRHAAYRGTAIFHAAGSYGAPLVASIRGLVQDGAGQSVAGLRLKVGDRQAATNRCGRFVFRDLPSSRVDLEVGGAGIRGITVPVTGLTPGRELEMAPIAVTRRP
ncbi:MAG: carboxypeptidase regulatory-like domain-containing protein [candidate division NC10 bacterium]|nr:carboxypeptidase regulatory-like domain-containing protein [candidate division NC10 bacterium]